MNLQRWLQLHTALLAVLGAGFLVLTGDRSVFPFVLGVSALAAFVVTDWLGWIRLPRMLSNFAALAAVAWTFREFMRLARDREAQLLTISHMLIYLQVMLLFQVKSRRVHWQLLVLSVLQVVVAAALALDAYFGLLLTLYMAAALACMILLCYEREVVDECAPTATSGKSQISLQRLLDPPKLQTSAARQQQLEAWVRFPWLMRGMVMFTLGSVMFAAVFFLTAPRLSEAMWQTARARGSVSGYSGRVQLSSHSRRINLSDQPVLRVSFVDPRTQRSLSLANEPYLHGQVLTTYYPAVDGGDAHWSYVPAYRMSRRQDRLHPCEEAKPGDLVRQEVVLDAAKPSVLFAMLPVKILPETPAFVNEMRQSPRLTRNAEEELLNPTREIRYSLGTLAIRNGRQLHAIPHFNPAQTLDELHKFDLELNHHRAFDAERFPRIKAAADEVIRSQNLQGKSKLIQAIALRNYLFASGEFQYALDVAAHPTTRPANTRLDPLEEFIAHRRRGHCEFFASALVMMLRSQDIPARLVVGYKGGDWNAIGRYYLVRQKHAHAWVEVLLTADQVPPDEIAGKPSAGGAWYRLDPTPASSEETALADRKAFGTQVSDAFDYVDYVWRDYVLGLNSGKQEEVLQPLASRSRDLLPGSVNPAAWQKWLRKTMNGQQVGALKGEAETANKTSETRGSIPWFRYFLMLSLVIAAPASVAGVVLFARFLVQRTWRRPLAAREYTPPLFLEFQRALKRQGIEVPANSTAAEIAELAVQRLVLPAAGAADQDRELFAILQTVVHSYHRVRFGGVKLNASERSAVSASLSLLQRTQARPSPSAKQ